MPSGTEVLVKDLQRVRKSIAAASTLRSYYAEAPINKIRTNHVYLTPLPNQQDKHGRPTPIVNQVPAENEAATPVSPILLARPKRIIKPSLKVRENLGLAVDDAGLKDFIDLLSVFSYSFSFP